MTNKNKTKKRKQARSSGFRDRRSPVEEQGSREERRGLLDGLFTSRSADATIPGKGASFGRGAIAAASSPAIVGSVVLSVFAAWLALIGAGFPGPFSAMASFLALPPIGTWFDVALADRLVNVSGVVAIVILIVVRSLLMGIFVSFGMDALTGVPTNRWSIVRAIRIVPVTAAVCLLGLGLTTLSTVILLIIGPGIGLLVAIGALAAGVYLFVFAPVIAVAEGRSMPDAIARSVRAARLPGSSNLMLAAIYALGAAAVFVSTAGGKLGVNPSPLAWAVVLLVDFIHVAVLTGFAYRYLSIAGRVPESPARRSPRSRAGRANPR